jgi:hypothetical protein
MWSACAGEALVILERELAEGNASGYVLALRTEAFMYRVSVHACPGQGFITRMSMPQGSPA